MALDFHRLDTDEYLFGLDEQQLNCLSGVFETFQHRTGVAIDAYRDRQFTAEHCRTLLQLIDQYIQQADLNRDRKKTTVVLGFRGVLSYVLAKNIDLQLRGD